MSTNVKRHWPSAGFFAIVTSYAVLAMLLIWGSQTPQLDKAFSLLSKRELDDRIEFSADDVQLLQQVWDAHAGFTRALLGKSTVKFLEHTESGWSSRPRAYLAVRPETDQVTQLLLEARGKPGDFPIKVRIHGKDLERRVELSPNQTQKVEWSPTDLRQPAILAVEVAVPNSPSDAAPTWAIRVSSASAGERREAHD